MHFFIIRHGKVTGVVSSLDHQRSPTPSGGLELPIKMTFEHDDVETINRLKRLLATYSYMRKKWMANMGQMKMTSI